MELVLNEIYKPYTISDDKVEYVAIVARYNEKWLIVRIEGTNTWGFPGGKIEKNEDTITAAKRELFEETGALDASYNYIGQYSVKADELITYGNLYYAEILKIEKMPDFEIVELKYVDDFPVNNSRYPKVMPALFDFVKKKIEE